MIGGRNYCPPILTLFVMNIIKCILLFFILLSCSNLSNRDKIDSKIYFKSVEGNKLDIDIELKFIPLETIDNNLIGNISQIMKTKRGK